MNERIDRMRETSQTGGRRIVDGAQQVAPIVRRHPLGAIAVTIGLGYILGKLLSPRD